MKIKFLEDRTVQDASGTQFKKGQVADVSEASANHWLTRGVAEVVEEKKKADDKK